MDDQTDTIVKCKPPGLLRRILWWLWIVFLAVLIILGLIFAAPWKVLVLLLIFLSAATILPRNYRKWFWLGVGVLILALVVWVFLPEDNKVWRPYTFDDELAELNVKYAIPDSQNAAVIYNQILEDWKQKEANEPNLPKCWFDFVRKSPWLSKDHPEIAAYLWYHRDTIDGIMQATKIEKCFFPFVSNISDFGKYMPRLPATRQWAYLLIAAGNNALAEGDINDSVEKYLAVLRMGQQMSRQPRSLDMLVGIACEALGLGGINNFIVRGNANELYLNKVEQAVSKIKHDWNSDLPGFIDSEKLMLKNMLGGLFYEVNSKGRVRFSHGRLSDCQTIYYASILSDYWLKKLFKACAILYWFYAPWTPEKLSEIVDTGFEKNYTLTDPDFNWPKEPPISPVESLFHYKMNFYRHVNLLAQMNMRTYYRFHGLYLKNLSMQRATLLIIAMRRFKNETGKWPEKLEDIKNTAPAELFIDHMNGDSFVYKLTEDNFILYSKGKNGIDEGGERQTKFDYELGKYETIKDDVMIWSPTNSE